MPATCLKPYQIAGPYKTAGAKKKYRNGLEARLGDLADAVMGSSGKEGQLGKGQVLDMAVEHIKFLNDRIQALESQRCPSTYESAQRELGLGSQAEAFVASVGTDREEDRQEPNIQRNGPPTSGEFVNVLPPSAQVLALVPSRL